MILVANKSTSIGPHRSSIFMSHTGFSFQSVCMVSHVSGLCICHLVQHPQKLVRSRSSSCPSRRSSTPVPTTSPTTRPPQPHLTQQTRFAGTTSILVNSHTNAKPHAPGHHTPRPVTDGDKCRQPTPPKSPILHTGSLYFSSLLSGHRCRSKHHSPLPC